MKRIIRYITWHLIDKRRFEKIKKEIEELEKEWEQNPPHSELK